MKNVAIVLFCDDFRVRDNLALVKACAKYERVVPVFIYDENYQGRRIGAAARVFLHYVLVAFAKLLKGKGAALVLRKGKVLAELSKVVNEVGAAAIYFNHSYNAKQIATEDEIRTKFKNLDVASFRGKILFEPSEIRTSAGDDFKVFTPFSKKCLQKVDLVGEFVKEPSVISGFKGVKSLDVADLGLLPVGEGDWDKKMIEFWEFDYEKIALGVSDFLDAKLQNYGEARNRADLEGCSRLSPYFRFGMISPRIVFNAARNREDSKQFVLELLWREFAYHVAFANPEIDKKELKAKYSGFEWDNDAKDFAKWRKGETGFDIVDAGMKEIWASGVMHNRVRMIVASFLIKDLLIDWRKGERYFWDCLVDADFAVNAFSWQWVFGSGYDAAPYFRVFNPDLQEKRFDPKKEYCGRWLGERGILGRMVDHGVRRGVVLGRYKGILA